MNVTVFRIALFKYFREISSIWKKLYIEYLKFDLSYIALL